MSVWTKPIFGTAPPRTPVTPVAVRCARLAAAGGLESLPWMVLGYIAGTALYFGGFMLVVGSIVRGISWVDRVGALLKGFGPKPVAVTLLVIAFAAFGLPPVARWVFERPLARLTAEQRAKARRTRSRASRLQPWGLAVLVVVIVGACVVPFIAGARSVGPFVGVMKILAGWGVATMAMSLRGRSGCRIVCGRCDYPMKTRRGAAERCPECGSAWKQPWKARLGARAIQWHMMAAGGVAVLGAGAFLVVARIMFARF